MHRCRTLSRVLNFSIVGVRGRGGRIIYGVLRFD